MSEALDVGTLSGRIELQDLSSKVLETIGGSLGKFQSDFASAGQTVLNQATAFFTAQAAINAVEGAFSAAIKTLEQLTVQGAKVSDVENSFDHLSTSAGLLSKTLLESLRQGTHSTIDDFSLMQLASHDLAAGLNLTDQQFGVLSKGAFALAKATGTDVKTALESMNDAMITGRVRALQLLTGKIDLTDAEDKFAKSLGVTTDHLSAQGKQAAIQQEILKAVGDATERIGVQQDGLREKLAQATTWWQDFQDQLGKTVATSPVLMAGINAVEDALKEAFGGSQGNLIKQIAHEIDNTAITAIEFGKNVVDALGIVMIEWQALKTVFVTVEQGIRAITYVAEELLLGLEKIANFASGGLALNDWIAATEKDIDRLYTAMAQGENTITGYKEAQQAAAEETGHFNDALTKIENRMKAAQKEQEDTKLGTDALASSTKNEAAAANAAADAHSKQALTIAMTKEEAKKLKDAQEELASTGEGWRGTLDKISESAHALAKSYLEAGASSSAIQTVLNLTAAQTAAIQKEIAEETKAKELERKEIEDSAARWASYYDLRIQRSGSTTDKERADIQKWVADQVKAHADAKTDTQDFYDWVEQMSREMYAQQEQQRLEADVHSKAHFEKMAQDAQEAFDFARANSDQFTQQYIDDLGEASHAADEAAKDWRDQMGGALDDVAQKAGVVKSAIDNLEYTVEGQSASPITQYTIDTTPGGADALLDKLNFLMQNIGSEKANIHDFASQNQYFADLAELNALKAAYDMLKSQSKKAPKFASGGIIDAGTDGTLAVLHGQEAVLPLSKERLEAFGIGANQVTNHFYVNGTGVQVANEVARVLMDQLKSVRQFGAA